MKKVDKKMKNTSVELSKVTREMEGSKTQKTKRKFWVFKSENVNSHPEKSEG